MVRKFLYIVAFLIVIVLAGAFALRIWSDDIARIALVPSAAFETQAPLRENAYDDPAMWISRPGMGQSDPARWQPPFATDRAMLPSPSEPSGGFVTFFVHPTSYLDRSRWNAQLDDAESQRVAKIYVRGMASAFNRADEIWAPKYRQATIGAFLTDSEDAKRALDAAYADVKQAFALFLATADKDKPIILAGHSQGALHLLRLLREDVTDPALKARIAAIYVVGWPVSVAHDLPSLGFPACATASQSGCIMSWLSYAEPADPSSLLETYAASTGFDGQPRGTSPILCTNPLTGGARDTATADSNLGALVPENGFETGQLVPGLAPARCTQQGLLLIGDPPEMGEYVLPGNNYHVYDIPLFWANVQQNAVERVEAWRKAP